MTRVLSGFIFTTHL